MKNTRLLALVILLIAVIAAIFRFWDVVMLFFLSAIIAYLLSPIVRLLTFGGRVPRGVAVAITALGVVGLLVWMAVLFVPFAVTQLSGVVNDLMAYAGSFDRLLASIEEQLAAWHLPQPVLDFATDIVGRADAYLSKFFSILLNWLMNTTTGLFDVVVVIILIIYFMLDGAKMIQNGIDALPERVAVRVRRVVTESNRYTWKYLGTRVLISLGMAVVSCIGFRIIGLKYALLFAILAFTMDFIPYFGSIIAGVVDSVFALITGGIGLAVKVLIFVLIVQQIEGNVVAPKLQGKSVDLHPIWVMFALLACSELWGPVGMLISTPLAAVVKTALRELYYYMIGDQKSAVTQVDPGPATASPPASVTVPVQPEPTLAGISAEMPDAPDGARDSTDEP